MVASHWLLVHHTFTGWHKKTIITKNRITSKILFRLTQNLATLGQACVADICKVSNWYYKNSLFHWRSKNVLQMSSQALQAHLDPAGEALDDPPTFLPWNRSYCCCDCCLQVTDSLGVVAIHPVLMMSPYIKIWGVQVRWIRQPLQVTPAADQSVRETLL